MQAAERYLQAAIDDALAAAPFPSPEQEEEQEEQEEEEQPPLPPQQQQGPTRARRRKKRPRRGAIILNPANGEVVRIDCFCLAVALTVGRLTHTFPNLLLNITQHQPIPSSSSSSSSASINHYPGDRHSRRCAPRRHGVGAGAGRPPLAPLRDALR